MDHLVLHEAFKRTREFLEGVGARPVGARASVADLRARLGVALPETGTSEVSVIRDLVAAVEPGLVASGSPRYFGFVTGGTLPVALAADWLTAAWDQNAALYVQSPAAAVTEEVVAGWLLELLHLPASASVGLVTGCQMANFTGLAAARGAVIRRAGLDPDEVGLSGAPPLTVVVGAEAHATIFTALRMLGIGRRQIRVAHADDQGRMSPLALAATLRACEGPTIVCAQVGNVNSGAADPIAAIADQTAERGAWLHVDGAFGLWAAASPRLAHLVEGLERADSWATDAHKWLNVPYDCGIAIVRDPAAHRAAVANAAAAYLVTGGDDRRDGQDWAPESSRRVRAFPLYAAIRALGRAGLSDLIERCCALARRLGDRFASLPGATVLNQIVMNQVVVTFAEPSRPSRDLTRDVMRRLQEGGACWAGPTVWRGVPAVRFSVSSWRTTAADVDRTADAVAAALAAAS